MKDLYDNIMQSIGKAKTIFTDNESEFKEEKRTCLDTFNQLEAKANQELQSLKDNQELERFTIACYGETNAGKSTLIESLRLYFKEASKQDQHKKFQEYILPYQELESKITALQQELDSNEATFLQNQEKIQQYHEKLETQTQLYNDNTQQLHSLHQSITQQQHNLSILQATTESLHQTLKNDEMQLQDMQQKLSILEKDLQLHTLKQQKYKNQLQNYNFFNKMLAFFGLAKKPKAIESDLAIIAQEITTMNLQKQEYLQLSLTKQDTITHTQKELAKQVELETLKQNELHIIQQEQDSLQHTQNAIQEEITSLQTQQSHYTQAQDSLQKAIQAIQQEKHECQAMKDKYAKELQTYQDGSIIGDGRSDFTRDITPYYFSYQNFQFSILDVPGIEGDEKQVIDEIDKATKKAHAILYIKKESTPPQKGDDNNGQVTKRGTIEKIKALLNAQTEVYAVYNKPITNYRGLEKEFISDNERGSLKVLDEKMQEMLGEHYKGHKSLSAQIAFYALAECLIEDSELYAKSQKFLDKFDKETLLHKSHFLDLTTFITQDLLNNAHKKIERSQLNKAYIVARDIENGVALALKQFSEKYQQEYEACEKSLGIVKQNGEKFLDQLDDSIEHEITHLENSVRKDMSSFIDRENPFNGKLKSEFETTLKWYLKQLPERMEDRIQKAQEQFVEATQKQFEKYQDQLQNIAKNFAIIPIVTSSGMSFNINVDHGISFGKIGWGAFSIVSTTGSTLLVLGTATLPALATGLILIAGAVGIITGIWQIGKGFRGVKPEYKRQRQKQEINRKLEHVSKKVKEEVEKELEKNKPQITQAIEEALNMFQRQVKMLRDDIESLQKIKGKLQTISNSIKGRMQ